MIQSRDLRFRWKSTIAIYICFKKTDYDKLQVKIIFKGSIFHLHETNTSYLHIYDSIFIQLPSYKMCILTGI